MRLRAFAFLVDRSRPTPPGLLLALLALLLFGPVLAYGQVTPLDEYSKLVHAAQDVAPVGAHPFGEQVNLYNGELSFAVTDVSIRGTGPLLELGRSFEVGSSGLYSNLNRELPFGDWDLEVPRIETYAPQQGGWQVSNTGNLHRCTDFNPPPPIANAQGGGDWTPGMWWYGYHLIVPGAGNQILLARMPTNTHAPTAGGAFDIVTKNDWMIGCGVTASDGGEGFLALAPDGTRYTFSYLVYRPMSAVSAPLGSTSVAAGQAHTLVAPNMILQRWDALMYVTKVEDRFGNTLTYNWSGGNLTSIVASDGRELDLGYISVSGASLVHTITLKAAGGAPARTWIYAYNTPSAAPPNLARVQLPDGSAWSYSLGNLQMAAYSATFQNDLCPGTGQLEIGTGTSNTTDSGSITAPSGVTGTFTVAPMLHARSYVPEYCTSAPGEPPGQGYPAIPDQYAQFSLTKEILAGPGIPAATWAYSYAPVYPSWSSDPCAKSKSCVSTVLIYVTDPEGYETAYTYSDRFDASEGKLLSTSNDSGGSGSPVVRSTTNTYANPTGGPWPTAYGADLQPHDNYSQTQEQSPLRTTATSQQGATFTASVNTYDGFARATSTTKSSSLGYSKTETTAYADDLTNWVLGIVTGTATNGITVSQTSYNGLDLPISESSFGRPPTTMTWNANGTQASQTDADGHATAFANWYRGLPGTITFADGTRETASINGDGWITALTDENGFATNYAYDPMGRLTQISYPTGDDVAWNPTVLSFTQTASTEFGIPGGHWDQVVHTGDDYTVTYFDAFWRPLVTEHYDSGNNSGTLSQVVQQYDAGGRDMFTSYPTRSATSYTQALPGSHITYDALNRVTEVKQDSSLGLLPTTTQYLSGFKTNVTDPNGNSTVTAYQAYASPDTQWPVSITAPDGQLTDISRDVFGKPVSITRTGTAAGSPALTRSFTYNAYQQLCARTEPETGTTAYGYDAADNLVWSASGLTGAGCFTEDQASSSGRMVTRSYDARNRLTAVTYPDGFSNTSYGYTPDGLVASQAVANVGFPVTTTYTYDKRRLLTSEIQGQPDESFSLGYGHDANGHLAATTYPDGRSIAYAPNALGQPTEAGNYASGATYYPNGAIAGFTFSLSGAVYNMTETERGFVGRSTDSLSGVAGMDFAYAYDGDANVAAITDYLPNNTGNVSMAYDGLNRLIEADSPMFGGTVANPGKAQYAYDVFSNLTAATVGNVSSFDYVYNGQDQLAELTDPSTGAALVSYTYDTQGNLANKNGQAYHLNP